ncbi:hypothetical protein Glove_29g177 [Diversispora epigaea]|uniref:Uncharacterized protein n=1 Tax=Diversispora epigaea TaxID=1348612 RepID=A0A397JHQ7_9GLOM|nr:hypothetical protein Glove_29g177 [Diversispora epigaea]
MFRGKKNLTIENRYEEQPKKFLKSLKKTWIRALGKKMSSIIHSQVQQQPPSTLSPSTSVLESPKQRSFNFLRHHVPKFKINCAKYYGNENLVVKYCTQYLDDFPLSYSTLCNRAETFGKLKRYDEALNDLNHAITVKPHKSTAWCLRGIIKGLKKFYMEALEDLNSALYRDKSNYLALKWRAFCYYEIHQYIHALWDLDLIINSGYADAFTYLNRADINRRLKKFVDANEDITKAFWFKNINKAFAYGIRRELKLDCEEFQDAIDDLNKALNFQPDNVTALRNRCKSHKMLMDTENALNDLNKLCILEPENDYQYELRGAILLDMRKYEDSLKNLNRAIESLPNNVVTIGNRAKLYCKLCQYNLALKDTQEGILIDPRNLEIRQQAMNLYRRKHQFDTALHEAEVILMIDHKNINTMLIRADIYFLKRKYNYSLADLDNANRIAPKNSFVLVSRSELFCKIKYYKDALRDVQSALEIKSANQYALEVRGNIYRKLHKYQEALVDFNKSLELYPLDMILEHHQNQDGKKEGCKVGGGKDDKDGKDDINEDDKDDQNLLVCKNRVGYDKGFVVTQQIFGERNFSRIYYRRGVTYSKLGMYELALEDFNRALELANGYAPIYKKRAYVLRKLENLDDTYKY